MSLPVFLWVVLFSVPAQGHEPAKGDKTPAFYLTTYSPGSYTAKTTHPEITIWTKFDPFTTPDDHLIVAQMAVSPRLSKEEDWGAVMVLHAPGAGDEGYIGDIFMRVEDHTYEDTKQTVKTFSFSLKAKYFRQATIRFWYGDVLDGDFELHLHKRKPKAEQGGADQPATAPE